MVRHSRFFDDPTLSVVERDARRLGTEREERKFRQLMAGKAVE